MGVTRVMMMKGLLEESCVAKIEDLSVILQRSPSSAERYLKQALASEDFALYLVFIHTGHVEK